MSNPYESVPYSSQQPPVDYGFQPPPYQHSMDLGRAIGSVFKSPNWMMNVIWVIVCVVLSLFVVGGIVLFGYQMDVIEKRSRGRSQYWPDFDPNRFVEYLGRGLWPWLMNFILMMAFTIPILAILGVVMAIAGPRMTAQNSEPSLTAIVMILLLYSIFMVAMMIYMIFVVFPCSLRAGLAQDLGQGFNFQWSMDFGKRMAGQMILAGLFAILISLVANFAGTITCFVGLIVTIPLAQLMVTDLGAQLYDIYLTRGGEPVPLRNS